MYVEGLGSATLTNNMLRLELVYRNAKGEDVSAGELIIPASRVAAFADGFVDVLKTLQEPAKG